MLPPAALPDLAAGPARKQDVAFYRLWTRNEATAKLQAHGLDCPHTRERPRIPRWTPRSFWLPDGEQEVVGALALESLG